MSPENLSNGNGVNSEGDVEKKTSVASRRLVGEDIASVAVQAAAVIPEGQRHYPKTVEEVIAQRKRAERLAGPERYDANAELGGGIPHRDESPHLPLENVLDDNYEPWQKDIRLAVEQFGLEKYSIDELKAMKPADFKLLCLYFYAYLENINTSIRLIDRAEGKADIVDYLKRRYEGQSAETLDSYRQRLDVLKSDLEATGMPNAVRVELNIPPEGESDEARRARLRAISINKRKNGERDIKVVETDNGLTVSRAML